MSSARGMLPLRCPPAFGLTVRLVAANEELRFPYGGYTPAAWNHDRVIRRTSSFDDDVRDIGAARRKRPRSLYSPP